MPVTYLSEEDQVASLKIYNRDKKIHGIIPLIQRNPKTGWPLLQVSLFSPSINDTERYEHVLGGGNCHYFYIGPFNFACALAKVPGKMEISGNHGQAISREQLNAGNVGLFLHEFRIKHQLTRTTIASSTGAYGKTLNVECPLGNSSRLQSALQDNAFFFFAFKRDFFKTGGPISDIGGWVDVPGYTESDIRERVNDEVAVFAGGQLFVDLGAFLERKVKDEEITEFFKHVFKVDEFLTLKDVHPELDGSPSTITVDDALGSKSILTETPTPASPASNNELPSESDGSSSTITVDGSLESKSILTDTPNPASNKELPPEPDSSPLTITVDGALGSKSILTETPTPASPASNNELPSESDGSSSTITVDGSPESKSILTDTPNPASNKELPPEPDSSPLTITVDGAPQSAATLADKQELLFNINPDERQDNDYLFNILKSTNVHLKNIYLQINMMRKYGLSLSSEHINKGTAVVNLADVLEAKIDKFYKKSLEKQPNKQDLFDFKNEVKVLLNSKNDLMAKHRRIWKPIIANILISLTGVGLLALTVHAFANAVKSVIRHERMTVSKILFFGKTTSEKKINDIEQAIESAPNEISKAK
jgi:hypothetical protein